MKKIGILGCKGFLGSYLVEQLSKIENYHVVGVDRSHCDFQDSTKAKSFLKFQEFDVIINCIKDKDHSLEASQSMNTINVFDNLWVNRHLGYRYINLGSGAEYDRTDPIQYVEESRIPDTYFMYPKDFYGASKRHMSSICYATPNFYTIRIFGIFSPIHQQTELFKRIYNEEEFILNDKIFDYFSIDDFTQLVKYYIDTEKPKFKDINAVNPSFEAVFLSTLADKFCKIHKKNKKYKIIHQSQNKEIYAGNSDNIISLVQTEGLKLTGLKYAMKQWAPRENDIASRLRTIVSIRRNYIQMDEEDIIAELLEEAANEIENLRKR